MRPHPRTVRFIRAKRDLGGRLSEWATGYDLSATEIIVILAEAISYYGTQAVRAARRPETPDPNEEKP